MKKFVVVLLCFLSLIISGCIFASAAPEKTQDSTETIVYNDKDFFEKLKFKDETLAILLCSTAIFSATVSGIVISIIEQTK